MNKFDLVRNYRLWAPGSQIGIIPAFVLESGNPGFSVGKKEDKLGIRENELLDADER
jgi:hypothetical protein